MSSSNRRRRGRVISGLVLCLGLSCAAVGCSKPAAVPALTCRILVEGSPLIGVHVSVYEASNSTGGGSRPLLVGVTDSSGVASMQYASGISPGDIQRGELRVALEGLGDGDWQIASPWNDAAKSALKLRWPPDSDAVDLVIPKTAIKTL